MTSVPVFLAHTDMAAVQDSARDLRALGPAAIRLLRSCVEHGEVRMARESQSALALESAGFVLIRQGQRWMDKPVQVMPMLAGEEALEAMDGEMEGKDHPCIL